MNEITINVEGIDDKDIECLYSEIYKCISDLQYKKKCLDIIKEKYYDEIPYIILCKILHYLKLKSNYVHEFYYIYDEYDIDCDIASVDFGMEIEQFIEYFEKTNYRKRTILNTLTESCKEYNVRIDEGLIFLIGRNNSIYFEDKINMTNMLIRWLDDLMFCKNYGKDIYSYLKRGVDDE